MIHIFIIYHGDIYRKKLIDNIIKSSFINIPSINYIYSQLNNKNNNINSNSILSYNDITDIIDHQSIWNKIVTFNYDKDDIYLIIDDTIKVNPTYSYTFNLLKTINSIINYINNYNIFKDWDIIYTYNKFYKEDYKNEIMIDDYISIPCENRVSYKSYFISYKGAQSLSSYNFDYTINLNKFLIKVQYNNELKINYWCAFTLKNNLFIDDNKNEDITQYIKSYNIVNSSLKYNNCYFTVIMFVNLNKEYHFFKRIINIINSYNIHIIPIFYDDCNNIYNKLFEIMNNFESNNPNNHFILFVSTIYFIINIEVYDLINFFKDANYDIMYLFNKTIINNKNFIESLLKNKISIMTLDKFININNNKYDITSLNIIYCNSYDNLFYNLSNNNRLKYDNNIGYFRYSNKYDYPLFIYSLKYNPLIDDMLNIVRYRGTIINSIIPTTPITLYSNNKLLIIVYVDENIYKMRGNFDWISKYRDKFVMPSSIDSIDIIVYTMDDNIYNILRQDKYKYNLYLIRNKREFIINILENGKDTYKYTLLTTGFHDINNIFTLYDLIYTEQTIIAPLIVGYKNRLKTLSGLNVIRRIVERVELGLWVIQYIKDTMMIKDSIYIDIIEYMRKNESNSLEIFEDYMIRCIRDLNIPIWYSNIRLYGLDIRI
jgi:hypothetical protein